MTRFETTEPLADLITKMGQDPADYPASTEDATLILDLLEYFPHSAVVSAAACILGHATDVDRYIILLSLHIDSPIVEGRLFSGCLTKVGTSGAVQHDNREVLTHVALRAVGKMLEHAKDMDSGDAGPKKTLH